MLNDRFKSIVNGVFMRMIEHFRYVEEAIESRTLRKGLQILIKIKSVGLI
jgi:hypothetical protein